MPGDEFVPKRNNFDDLQEYHIQCAVVTSLSKFRDAKGWSPNICRKLLVDLLRLNDNTGNKALDDHWVALLINLVGDTFLARPKTGNEMTWTLGERAQ